MYIPVTVNRPAGASLGAPAPQEPNVTIVALEDILYFPQRDSKGVLMVGNFAMKPGAKMIQFYQTAVKAKASMESEGDGDSITVKHKFETEVPGDQLEMNELLANWMGVDAIVIYGSCVDAYRQVVGTKCAPVKLKLSSQDDNEARKKMLVFEQEAKSRYVLGRYTGSLSLATNYAVAVDDIDLVPLVVANGPTIQLPELAVTAVIGFNPDGNNIPHGGMVTLIGGGGAGPATLASTAVVPGAYVVLLRSAQTWVALKNATITLQVFMSGANVYLIEVART